MALAAGETLLHLVFPFSLQTFGRHVAVACKCWHYILEAIFAEENLKRIISRRHRLAERPPSDGSGSFSVAGGKLEFIFNDLAAKARSFQSHLLMNEMLLGELLLHKKIEKFRNIVSICLAFS